MRSKLPALALLAFALVMAVAIAYKTATPSTRNVTTEPEADEPTPAAPARSLPEPAVIPASLPVETAVQRVTKRHKRAAIVPLAPELRPERVAGSRLPDPGNFDNGTIPASLDNLPVGPRTREAWEDPEERATADAKLGLLRRVDICLRGRGLGSARGEMAISLWWENRGGTLVGERADPSESSLPDDGTDDAVLDCVRTAHVGHRLVGVAIPDSAPSLVIPSQLRFPVTRDTLFERVRR